MTSRRFFLASIPAGALALGMGSANAAVALSETDPAAAGLGYKADASTVDTKKSPTYASGHQCSGCQMFSGKPSDATAPCTIFSGKLVSAKGWCAAWNKKS